MSRMLHQAVLLVFLGLQLSIAVRGVDISSGTADGSEKWGYLDVRPGAHMFWWLYNSPKAVPGDNSTPLILWIQGGPGASGAGYGNFAEIGPLREDLTPRQHTWLNAAHLLFVDNPVGTGFSYVDDTSLLAATNRQVTVDLVNFLRAFMHYQQPLRAAPLYVFCESYGGKFVSELAVALHETLAGGTLQLNFKGVALGDTWISPIAFLKAWGPQLRTLSLLDDKEEEVVNEQAAEAEKAIAEGRWSDATDVWAEMEGTIGAFTDEVDWYNYLLHNVPDDEASAPSSSSVFASRADAHFANLSAEVAPSLLRLPSEKMARGGSGSGAAEERPQSRHQVAEGQRAGSHWEALRRLATRHLARQHNDILDSTMNGPVREKLKIIPANVRWGMSSNEVFTALSADFMRPTIDMVDKVLELGINITLYSGQLDLICCTDGTENWMRSLKWQGMESFYEARRAALYCGESDESSGKTGAFVKRHANLAFFWVMNAGHMVPADNPCMALNVVRMITGQA